MLEVDIIIVIVGFEITSVFPQLHHLGRRLVTSFSSLLPPFFIYVDKNNGGKKDDRKRRKERA